MSSFFSSVIIYWSYVLHPIILDNYICILSFSSDSTVILALSLSYIHFCTFSILIV